MKKLILNDKSFTVFITIFYILGIFGVFYKFEILSAFLALALCLVLIFLFKYENKKVIILYLIFFVSILRCNSVNNLDTTLDNFNCNNAILKGKIISSKKISTKNQRVKFDIKVNEANVYNKTFDNLNSKILVSLDITNDILDNLEIGDTVELKGNLRTIKEASNPYQFNYKKYLENNDIKNVLYGKTQNVEILEKANPKTLEDNWYFTLNRFEKIRNKILEKHSKNISSPYLEILGGIVFGNETINPDENIKENFKNSGLLHLLAASGLNVALIYGIWCWIANLAKFPYNLSIGLGCVFIIFYTFMTGFPPSILRASLMLLFVLFGKIIDRKADSIALIFFVGFLILLFNPKMFFDVGFQLSFMVTLGLITCCGVIIEKVDDVDKKFIEKHKNKGRIEKYFLFLFSPKNLVSIFSVPLIAQLWVIPLQMHYFNNLAPLSVFANVCVVPFIGVLSFVGFISSIAALVPNFSTPVVFVFDMIAKPFLILLVKISAFFASFKYSLVSTMGLNPFQMFNFWIILLVLTLNIKNSFKNKRHLVYLFIIFLIFSLSLIKVDCFNRNLEIMMFDVENADSFLIKTPKNKYILIDTGRKTYKGITSADSVINPYFKNKRIKKLNSMIITHFDIDHSGGVIDILNLLKVENIYIQTLKSKSKYSSEILKYLKDNNLNYKVAKNNDEIYSEKDLKIYTFKTNLENLSNKDKSDNENSIITLLKYKNKNILFMADAGVLAFDEIKDNLPDKIDILKVGHHGAKDTINQNMLDKIKPDYALISTGVNNFNHPHFSTINLLNDNNVKTVSSKNFGFVKVIIKDDFKFSHFEKGKMNNLFFDKNTETVPFNKTKYVQKFIENNKKDK